MESSEDFFQPNVGEFETIQQQIDPKDLKRGVILRSTNWLGDIMMTLPGAFQIRKMLPHDTPFYVSCYQHLSPLWQACDWVDQVLTFKKRRFNSTECEEIKALDLDLGIIFPNSLGSSWDYWRNGIRPLVGRRGNFRSLMLKHQLPAYKRKPGKDLFHQVRHYLEISQLFGNRYPSLEYPGLQHNISLKRQESLLRNYDGPMLILAPGAAYGPAKQWPQHYYLKLAQWWQSEVGVAIFVGSGKEKELCQRLSKSCNGSINLAGKTNLSELIWVIQQSNCVVSNDSGVMHLASGCQKNGVAIFGSTDPLATGPIGGKWIVHYLNKKCSPCLKRICPLKENHYNCLKDISVEAVIQDVIKINSLTQSNEKTLNL